MAADSSVEINEIEIRGSIESPSSTLHNCIMFSNNYRYLSAICDFGIAIIAEIEGKKWDEISYDENQALPRQRRDIGSTGMVTGRQASTRGFVAIHRIDLYYIPKDITFAMFPDGEAAKYRTAIAGPNGVELKDIELLENSNSLKMSDVSPLHADLAIILVEFSPDGNLLAVAALDCHFGIWNICGDRKDFWYVHISTVRITSIAFAPDSESIAVACWDGACFCYTKASDGDRAQWVESSIDGTVQEVKSSGDKFSGVLPGCLACWTMDNSTTSFSVLTEEGSWIKTTNYKNQSCQIQKISGRADHIKGMRTFRDPRGEVTVCMLSSKKMLQIKRINQTDRAHKGKEEVLLVENVLGSLWLIRDFHGAPNSMFKLITPDAETISAIKHFDETCLAGMNSPNKEPKTKIKTVAESSRNIFTTTEESVKKINQASLGAGVTYFSCPLEPSLLLGNSEEPLTSPKDATVLVSLSHVVIVRRNVVAYVYSREKDQWRALLLDEEVTCCCVTQGRYLVTCSSVVQFWSLGTLDLVSATPLPKLCVNPRLVAVGSVTQPVVQVVDVDGFGEGDTLTFRLTDNFTTSVQVQPISVPSLSPNALGMRAPCCFVGGLLVVRSDTCRESSSSTAHAWSVIRPELGVRRDFMEKREVSVAEFVVKHRNDLMRLDLL
ncbi:predicted protein [Nematostella vectensis]|uniref:Uncharacterized protein n=1 Tax=Nematostella vectensis TaxID=45351 RepID=A7SV89_NEMVE|nr:predicted protein [Nematostella vectensis]|eukprot:XP_001624468.1 predicted protein [Nematostella vectensis]